MEKIKSMKYKRDFLLAELIDSFFTKKEISSLNKKLEVKDKSNLKKTNIKTNKLQIPILTADIEIELIITFAFEKLSDNKYLEFLFHLGQYTITTGQNSQAIYIHENILRVTEGKVDFENFYANASLALGELYSRQALWKLCLNYIKQANKIFRKQNNLKGASNCENLLGTVYGEYGNLKKAKEHFEKSISFLDPLKDSELIGKIENNLGITYNIQGELDTALSYYNRALTNFEKIRDLKRMAEVHHNMGMLYSKKDSSRQAIKEFDASIAFAKRINYKQSLVMSYLSKAHLLIIQKDFNLAEALTNEAFELCNAINDKMAFGDVFKLKGVIQRNFKKYSLAEHYLSTSIRINKELKNELNHAESEFELGILYSEKGELKESKKHFLVALKYYKKIKAQKEIKEIERNLKNIYSI